ncbi:MAG TPA: hypothetical protein VHT91_40020 [Kofleriaceae bacterium]|jgi:hypothetical protein|nr:hypothetical protein [Kofleriaceae bacterium]
MVNLGVRGPEHRTSRLAGAVSLALHGALVGLIALGGKHLLPAPREPASIPIEIVGAAPVPPAPPPSPARTPTAARPANPRGGAGASRREPVQHARPVAAPAAQPLADLRVHYDDARSFADHGTAARVGATRAAGSGIGVGLADRLADGIGSLDIPEPPAGVSLARPPRPKHDYLNQRIVGASRFAGQTIKLLLSIDDHGRVRGVQVVQGVDPEIDRKTALRVRSFEFDPALDDAGVAIAATKRCEFEIVRDDGSF